MNLDHWLSQAAKGMLRIAVSLNKVLDVNSGILLEVREQSGTLELIKVGCYDIGGDLEMPQIENTAWLVR
jgi:hypothetical protein